MTVADTNQTGRWRELDSRSSNGIDVLLVWNEVTGERRIVVNDQKDGDDLSFTPPAGQELDAFQHPYAYAIGLVR